MTKMKQQNYKRNKRKQEKKKESVCTLVMEHNHQFVRDANYQMQLLRCKQINYYSFFLRLITSQRNEQKAKQRTKKNNNNLPEKLIFLILCFVRGLIVFVHAVLSEYFQIKLFDMKSFHIAKKLK